MLDIEVKTFIAVKVGDHYGSRCPVCNVRFATRNQRPGGNVRPDYPTRAHDDPRCGPHDTGRYVFTCSRCNEEQDRMTFASWASRLRAKGDPRAAAVQLLADRVAHYAGERVRKYGR